MSKEKYKATWLFKKQIGIDLFKLADGGSVNGLASDLLEDAIENSKRITENKSLDREIAELKGFEIIDGCTNVRHLKSAMSYINLFNLGYGSSKTLNSAYKAKKQSILKIN